MGLATATWRFATCPPPDLDAVGVALAEATGLEVTRDRDGRSLALPTIRQVVMGWEYTPDRLTLHGFLPPHPYLWAQLDAVLERLGGVRIDGDRGDPRLRLRWDALSRRDQWLLRLSPIGAFRPLDRFVSARPAEPRGRSPA